MELVEFLRARLRDDQDAAEAATTGPWRLDGADFEVIYGADDSAVIAGGRWHGEASVFDTTADAIHVARHDPARVLREVEAKRRQLDLAERMLADAREMTDVVEAAALGQCGWALLRLLALPYADHPDYRDEWKP